MSAPEQPRVLSLTDAVMVVVSSVIGVGIFLTPGSVAHRLPNPVWFGAAWALGGVLSLAGALANAELGAMYPQAGGNYVYLRAAYHPMAGFVVGWVQFFAIFAGTIATLASGFTLALEGVFHLSSGGRLAVEICLIWGTSVINAYATRAGAWLNTKTAYVKIGALVLFVLAGPLLGRAHVVEAPLGTYRGALAPTEFGAAMSPVLFSYLGWNASVYVAGEIEAPGKNLPRSLFLGLGLCTLVYILVNGTYVYALGMDALASSADGAEAAAVTVGTVLFGSMGGAVVTSMMLVSIFGALNANVLVGPRIAFAMANDGLFLRAAGRLSARTKTPSFAVFVQALAATALVVVFDEFPNVLDYTTFAIVLATIADTLALYMLRRREPNKARPYRAMGYPLLPLFYIGANVLIGVAMMRARPFECTASLGVLALGAVTYALVTRRRSPAS